MTDIDPVNPISLAVALIWLYNVLTRLWRNHR